jgi:phosphate acetyltransferase
MTKSSIVPKHLAASRSFLELSSITIRSMATLPLPSPADRFRSESQLLRRGTVHLIGVVSQSEGLTYPRTLDIQRHLKAEVLHAGEMDHRRVKHRFLMGRRVPNSFHALVPGAILVTGADRDDFIVAAAMAALSKVPLAGLILTGYMPIDGRVLQFCKAALDTGLPLLRVRTDSYETATQLFQFSSAVPADDLERTQAAADHAAQTLDVEWLISQSKKEFEFRLSPAAFLYQLTEKARSAKSELSSRKARNLAPSKPLSFVAAVELPGVSYWARQRKSRR